MLDQLRKQLRGLGATKLSWSVERELDREHVRWICTFQAANEMGAPVDLPPEVAEPLEHAIRDGHLGALEEDIWIMDLETGRTAQPQPRPGDGAGAPGVAERTP